MGLVDGRQRARGRGQKLHLGVALANLVEPGAEGGDRLVMRVEQPPFRQQRMHEGIADGAFDRLAELRPRHQECMDVDSVGVKRQARCLQLLIVYRHQRQVDVGLRPDGIVREAAAEDGGQDRAVLFHLRDEDVERLGELLPDGLCPSAHCSRASSETRMLSTNASGDYSVDFLWCDKQAGAGVQ